MRKEAMRQSRERARNDKAGRDVLTAESYGEAEQAEVAAGATPGWNL